MKLFSVLLFYVYLNFCWSFQVIDELKKQINDGEILGRYITSETGRTVSAFIGIPFATPPVGNLRFKAPRKSTPWNGTLLTQNERSKCPQIDLLSGVIGVDGDEDCLFVNVYVPETSTNNTSLDVLVYFHGGVAYQNIVDFTFLNGTMFQAFILGHAGPSTYGPEYLLDHDVILVAGNYRIGALGFLSTEDRNCPGNFGLKDQALLLQWVQDNIEHFGGNKDSVTIWGQSSGATSVAYQMISPLSEGRFHRAISNSGGLLGPARAGVARQQAIRLSQLVNCSANDTKEMVECLRNVPIENFIFSGLSFPIVVESFESDEPAFIDQRNYNNRFSNFAAIPWLVGMNSEEGLLNLGASLDNSESLDELLQNWDSVLPTTLGYGHLNATDIADITRSINGFYFGNEATPTNPINIQTLIDVFTDRFLVFIETVQKRLEENSQGNTYVYLFTHKGRASLSGTESYFGTAHSDDLISLFPFRKTVFYSTIPSRQDRELMKFMSLMWTNFARFGDPNEPETPIWPLVTNSTFASMQYLQIGNENGLSDNEVLQAKEDYFSTRAEFWRKIREDYNLNSWMDDDSFSSSR